jgi:hypothetical protein
MTTFGFTVGYLVTILYFGDFGHKGVKISKSHTPIFYSKSTMEHDGTSQNAWISTLSRPKTDL